MISAKSIQAQCTPAVYRRAQLIAEEGEGIYVRKCRYDGSHTVLRAKLEASSSWEDSYRVSVVLDEEADTIVDYDCDCPSARRTTTACKHVATLVLDFNERPQQYEGYADVRHLFTSQAITRLMHRAEADVPAAAAASSEPAEGTVAIEPTLSYGTGFDVRFRVLGTSGAYVMRSIAEFASDVEAQAYRAYGKHLAFTHSPAAFTASSQPLVAFLVRAIQNRRAYAFERTVGRGTSGTTSQPMRELHLSAPELWELLSLCERGILLEERISTAGNGASPATDGVPRSHAVIDADPPVHLSLVATEGGAYRVERPRGLRVVLVGGRALAWDADSLYRCSPEFSRRADLLAGLLRDPSEQLLVAERDLPKFCSVALPRLEEALPVTVPHELDALRPSPCELQFRLDRTQQGVTCEAIATYGDHQLPLMVPRTKMSASPDETGAATANVVRDVRTEARGRELVRRYFSVSPQSDLFVPARNEEALARLLYEGVAELQRIGKVLVTQAFEHLRSKARPRVQVGLSVHSNLLHLTLSLKGLPQSELAGILSSYRLKRQYHRLRDGAFLDLNNMDLSEAGAIADELGLDSRELATGEVSVPAYHALLLEELAPAQDRDKSFEAYVTGIRSVDLASYNVPATLADTLRPYQVEGFRWLCALADLGLGGILADEMGLGKSIQLISFFLAMRDAARATGPSLIVCPASLVYNWQAEFDKFAPELSVAVVAGTSDERQELRRTSHADVLITSYDLARRDVVDYAHMRLWCLAIDEAQYIKNHETMVARAVKSIYCEHRVALTGTPVENRLSELWSILDFLMPGLFGSYEHFRERYEHPIVEEGDERTAERLRHAVRPFVLRREKKDVVRDLPEKIEQVVHAHMQGEQRALYEAQVQELRDHVGGTSGSRQESFGRQKMQILAMLTRLRQICCDPRLVFEDYESTSCKSDTIMTLVERTIDAGQKALVFSQFTSFLDLLAAELDRRGVSYLTITGATTKRRRMELVDQFNEDDTPVFLISLKAGGTGLNLTGATVVIHADPWWNVAAQNQATDRAHRIGQTRDVTVYKVIASRTIEERILELQQTKAQLAESVVSGDVSGLSLASLTPEDLEDLLA